jgi:SHS2 domain-containing protein
MGEWREFDTTADTGIEVWGNDFNDLLATAGRAFTEMTTNPSTIKLDCSRRLEIESRGLDLKLRDFLAELLYILETDDLLPIDFHTFEHHVDGFSCTAVFCKWVDGVSESRTEIKAVTYHMLEAERQKDGVYYGRVVFDI